MLKETGIVIGSSIAKGGKDGVVFNVQLLDGRSVPVFTSLTAANVMLAPILVHTKHTVSDALLKAASMGAELTVTFNKEGEDYLDKDGNVLDQFKSSHYAVELQDARPIECAGLSLAFDFASGYLAKKDDKELVTMSAITLLEANEKKYDMLVRMGLIPAPAAFMSLLMTVVVEHFRSPRTSLDITRPKKDDDNKNRKTELELFVDEAKFAKTMANAADKQTIDIMLGELLNGTKSLEQAREIMATLTGEEVPF